MTHVVVVGAGIAGVPAAYSMINRLGINDKVTVVSDKDYFHFVPSNPWVAMGWRDKSDVMFPIGPCLAERGIEFIPKALRKVDGANSQIELVDGTVLGYDYLILATGPEAAFDEVEGLDPKQGKVHSVVHIEDAARAHAAYQQFIKEPGPIVIGAMQNSSILGPIYEFAFLVDADLRRRNIRSRVPITLVTPEPYVGHLGLGSESDTRKLLEQALADRQITYLTNIKTISISAGTVHVAECDAQGNEINTRDLPFSYAAYWAAFRGIHALRDNTDLTNERGFVKTDEYLRNPKYLNIYAVGVCGAHASVSQSPLPMGAPDSVYSIQNEVDAAVRNIAATLGRGEMTSPVPTRAKWLTDMSKSGASYHSEPQIPLRNINWLKEGRWVHLAKVEFENYFINKIKLKPAASDVATYSHIATLVRKLQFRKSEKMPAIKPVMAGARMIELAVQRSLDYDLRALAKVLGQNKHELMAQLMESAVRDAASMLGEVARDDMQKIRHDLMVNDLPENQPGVDFHGGGT